MFKEDCLRQELIALYDLHAEQYSTVLEKYQVLIEQRRELGISPLRTIPKSDLKQLPRVEFFEMRRDDACAFLQKSDKSHLANLLKLVSQAVDCYQYRTLLDRVRELMYTNSHPNRSRQVNTGSTTHIVHRQAACRRGGNCTDKQ